MTRRRTTLPLLALLLSACGPAPGDIGPLSMAARTGDVAEIKRLVAAGHDINANDPGLNHWTPLLHAIHKRQRGSIDALLELGADVHRGTVTSSIVDDHNKFTPLMMAVGNGQADIVGRLLAAGADPRRDGGAIFAMAVTGGAFSDIENPLLGRCNTEVVRALLQKDPTLRVAPGPRGGLVRLFARLNGCDEVLRLAAR
jgi:ankyrin repeat protein